jgi:uncharacterized protein (TIGR04551 family)
MKARDVRHVLIGMLVAAGLAWVGSGDVYAAGLTETGEQLRGEPDSTVELDGYFRTRGTGFYNLDLDRGPTPSGQYFFPLPLSNPSSPWLTRGDMRLRTDLTIRPRNLQASVNVRIDVLDNLTFGSTPRGTPLTTTSQQPPGLEDAFRIKRAYGQILTPFGLLAVGRMGAHWGLGLLANGGDCRDCDTGDAADRVAFMTTIADHVWSIAYDIGYRGPTADRIENRDLDLDPADNLKTVTFAVAKYRREWVRDRRRRAGRSTVDYGAYVSHRWQRRDVPTHYLPTADEVELTPAQSMQRNFQAIAVDGWFRWIHPMFRIELELAYLGARIEQPSLVPGVRLDSPITSRQWGGALETNFGPPNGPLRVGVDLGAASGDEAPGFGANPGYRGGTPQSGDLEGIQSDPPDDIQVNNFRFHPDYHIDRILFRHIVGAVTDATYVRPHAQWRLLDVGPSTLQLVLAAPISWALTEASTPGTGQPLGAELDPSLVYRNDNGFLMAFDYGVLFPFEGLDNTMEGVGAQPAQLFRLSAMYAF